MRTDQQIIDQTNDLARTLYRLRGYQVPEGYRFDKATHPDERGAWLGAVAAQMFLTDTDPVAILAEMEEEEDEEDKPASDFSGVNSPLNWKWTNPTETE